MRKSCMNAPHSAIELGKIKSKARQSTKLELLIRD